MGYAIIANVIREYEKKSMEGCLPPDAEQHLIQRIASLVGYTPSNQAMNIRDTGTTSEEDAYVDPRNVTDISLAMKHEDSLPECIPHGAVLITDDDGDVEGVEHAWNACFSCGDRLGESDWFIVETCGVRVDPNEDPDDDGDQYFYVEDSGDVDNRTVPICQCGDCGRFQKMHNQWEWI